MISLHTAAAARGWAWTAGGCLSGPAPLRSRASSGSAAAAASCPAPAATSSGPRRRARRQCCSALPRRARQAQQQQQSREQRGAPGGSGARAERRGLRRPWLLRDERDGQKAGEYDDEDGKDDEGYREEDDRDVELLRQGEEEEEGGGGAGWPRLEDGVGRGQWTRRRTGSDASSPPPPLRPLSDYVYASTGPLPVPGAYWGVPPSRAWFWTHYR